MDKKFFFYCSVIVQMLFILGIVLKLHLGDQPGENELPPMIHCFPENLTTGFVFDSKLSLRPTNASNQTRAIKLRPCAVGEQSTDLLNFEIVPILFSLLFSAFLASFFILCVANFLTLYRWSKRVAPSRPVVSTALVQDYLRSFADLDPDMRSELAEMFSFAITFEKRVLVERDKFGETSVHAALTSDLYEQAYQMLCAGADFDIADFSGKTARQVLDSKLSSKVDPTLEKIWKRLQKNEGVELEHLSVWTKTNPMMKSAVENNLHKLVFLQTIGGQVRHLAPDPDLLD